MATDPPRRRGQVRTGFDELARSAGADEPTAAVSIPPAERPPSLDALMPPEIAAKAADIGVSKASMGTQRTFYLGVLAGAFIALGAMFATTVLAGTGGEVAFGFSRLIAGVAFCLGLILVVVAGAELFTGNNLIVMAWAGRRIPLRSMMRNWAIVYAGNLVGALGTVFLVYAGSQYTFGDGAVGETALTIAEAKGSLDFGQAFALGILANALVCLAIWLTYSARSVIDKVVAVLFPITAFVAAGFEHSIANMYFLPIGVLIKDRAGDGFYESIRAEPADFPDVTWVDTIANLIPVTLGTIIGGGLLVGIVYWLIYQRTKP